MSREVVNVIRIHKDDLWLLVDDNGNVDFSIVAPMPGSIVTGGYVYERNLDDVAVSIARLETDILPDGPLSYVQANGNKVHIENPTRDDWDAYGRLVVANRCAYKANREDDWMHKNWGPYGEAYDTEMVNKHLDEDGKWKDGDEDGWVTVCFWTPGYQVALDFIRALQCECEHRGVDGEAYYPDEFYICNHYEEVIIHEGNVRQLKKRWTKFFVIQAVYEGEDGELQSITVSPETTSEEFKPFRQARRAHRFVQYGAYPRMRNYR